MELRKFTAMNMREAMDMVRQELGEDAVILDTRTIREAAAPDHPPIERVEVWAQLPESHMTIPKGPSVELLHEPRRAAARPTAAPVAPPPAQAGMTPDLEIRISGLREQLEHVHARMDTLADTMNWLGVGSLGSSEELAQYLTEGIGMKLPYSGGIQLGATAPHKVALVGPTGVGKTSMIARLAYDFAINAGRSVGIITADTTRVGAIEQIRTFCAHMALPLEIVYTPDEITESLERFADRDLVLIDTPGGSQRNPAFLRELRDLLDSADSAEVHLVISAISSAAVVRDIMHRFSVMQPDQLIFTKLDESPVLLDLFSLVFGSGLLLSYYSTGPQVPADMVVASSEATVQFLSK